MSALVLAQEAATPGVTDAGLAAIGYGLAAIGPALGVGMIFSSVINGTARQPEARGVLLGLAWTTFAIVEVLALLGFVVFFLATG